MARKKASKTATVKTKGRTRIELPKGYAAITGGAFGNSWDFSAEPTLEGVLMGSKKIKRNKVKKGQDPFFIKYIVKRSSDGMLLEVFEKAALRGLATIKKGRRVFLGYNGLKKIKGQPRPMHDFVVGSR